MEACVRSPKGMARAWRSCEPMGRQTVFLILCIAGSLVCLLPMFLDFWAAADGTGSTIPFVTACAISYLYTFMGLVAYCLACRTVTGETLTLSVRQAAVSAAVMLIPPLLCVALMATEVRQRGTAWDQYWPDWLQFWSDYLLMSHDVVFRMGLVNLYLFIVVGLIGTTVLLCFVVPRMRKFKGTWRSVSLLLRCNCIILLLIVVFRLGAGHCCCVDPKVIFVAELVFMSTHLPAFASIGICMLVAQKIWRPYKIHALSMLSVVAAFAAICLIVSTLAFLVGWRPDTRRLELPSRIASKTTRSLGACSRGI